MKIIFKFFVLLIIVSLHNATICHAQQMLGPTYDVSIPLRDMKTHVSNVSIVGFGLDARQMMNQQVSFGVTFHWNFFKDDRLEQVDTGEGTFVSIDDRSLESYPILLNTHYYFFNENASFRPFIGTNIGTYFIIKRQNIDGIRRIEKNWHLGVAPDIGFLLHFIKDVHVTFTLRFNYAGEAGAVPAQTYWSVIFGFVSMQLF